jgi:hypothetical protein
MSTHLRATLLAAAVALSGCDCSGGEAPGGAAGVEMPPLPDDVPQQGSIYREAYDKAKKELTMDNARDRLDEIERLVVREREELR